MKKKNRLLRLSFLTAFLAFFGLGHSAWAQTNTWTGATGNWNTGLNWSLGVPTASHDVVIPTGAVVTIDVNAAARSITLNGNASLTVGAFQLDVAQAGAGAITLNGTSSLTFAAVNPVTIGSPIYVGSIIMNDNSNITFGAITVISISGVWTKGENATITRTANPSLTLNGSTSMTLPSSITTLNLLTINKVGSSVTLSDNLTTTTTLTIPNGTLIVGNNNLTVTTTTDIAAGATLNGSATSTHSRTFTGVVTASGTLNLSGANVTNTITVAPVINATGVVNLNNSTTTFGATLEGAASGATVNALGSTVSFTGVVTWTNLTFNTNSNTNLTFNAAQTGGVATNIPAMTVHNLTFGNQNVTRTLAGDVTVYGNFVNGGNLISTIVVGSNNLTVYGNFNNIATNIVDATGSIINLYGPVTAWGADQTQFVTTATTTLNILGSGSLHTMTNALARNIGLFTMNRANETLTIAGAVVHTFQSLTITSGTVRMPSGVVHVVATTTNIGTNGTLDLRTANFAATHGMTFTGAVSGTGTILADNGSAANAPVIAFSAAYSFTGQLITDTRTSLIFNTGGGDVSLNSSVTNLNILTINNARKVTLNNNLTLAGAISASEFVSGVLVVNGYTLTFENTYTDAGAAWTLSAQNSSLVFVSAATFVATTTYNIDETTNLEFRATPTLVAGIAKCKNLTIVANGAATTVTPLAALTVHGNLSLNSTGVNVASMVATGFNLTVHADISLSQTASPSVLNITGRVLTVYGSIQGEGTYTTNNASTLVVAGTSSQLVLPAIFGATALGQITLNRPSGMKINRNITIGSATLGLTLTNGDLDLNGYVITLGDVATVISETAGNTVINTGATAAGTNGFIETAAGVSQAQAIASGIGVVNMSVGGNVQVRRYPMTVPIIGVGLSTARVYQVLVTAPTAITLQYDNSELNSSASDLRLFTSANISFAVKDDRTVPGGGNRTVNANTPAGKGNVAYSSFNTSGQNVALAVDHFYALAAPPGDGGVMRIAMNNGNWNNAATWSPAGIPSKIDQVVIGPSTVTLSGNGVTYESKTLLLNHANATLQPANNNVNGDVVNLRTMGNITLVPGAEILGVNGMGRLNLIIGDGVTQGVSSTISGNSDYVATSGVWVNDLTVNMADFSSGTNRVRISGDVTVLANAAVQIDNVEFRGGFDANQQISVPGSANLAITTARFDNNANVTTTSNFTLANHFLVKSGSTFNATGGTATFSVPQVNDGDPWNVENGGTLRFNNVEFNSSVGAQTFAPLGTAYIQGNFYQYGTDAFAPTSGRVIFGNTSQKEIVNTQTDADLVFWAAEFAHGTKVVTSNNWQVSSEIDVKANASLIADNGTIAFVNPAPATKWIKNSSTQTLEFNNLTITNGTVYTNDSWTIKGNLITTEGLIANNGTITFENIQEKSITATTAPTFFKLRVTNGSRLTTNAAHNFTIANNATNPTGAGIEVVGNGQFYVGSAAAVTTFNAGVGISAGNPKTIVKSAGGRLEFGHLLIAATPNNEVSTASDFTIKGGGAAAYTNLGAGGKFTATAGIITFDGTVASPQIISVSPSVSQFFGIRTIGSAALTFPNAAQEIFIAGNVTIDGQSSFAYNASNNDNKVIFNGGSLQTISGNTAALTSISLADVVINKANNSELLLDINTTFGSHIDHELTLTNGILNLGSKTLTCGAGIISRHNGVINGGTGTYVIATGHQTPMLEDVYFTINGTPTLYNLTVNALHTTANDLTVNGNLTLTTGNIAIGAGVDANNPIVLYVNGNLTRTIGIVTGSATTSRLVLQGTGTVTGGLNNAFFTNPATATSVQLEVARQEMLGGNLNIANSSLLRINTGINDFDLGTNTLTFLGTFNPVVMSGGTKAGAGSSVVLPNLANITIPASMFRNNEVNNLTTASSIILASDLKINGTLSGLNNITTNDNTLTFAQNATMPAFTSSAHVVGNLRRYVTNAATTFPVGNGSSLYYTPLTLQFANVGSVQAVKVSRTFVDPAYSRGGNPTNTADVLWTITPEGTNVADSLRMTFAWPSQLDGGTTPSVNASFPAKWNGERWLDYRNRLNNFTLTDPRTLVMNGFAVANSSALAGEWAVFNATANTNAAKDAAINVDGNRIVITELTPTPVVINNAFKVTVQLQDKSGQPIVTGVPFAFNLSQTQGSGFAGFNGIIPTGQSMTTVSGLSFTAASGNAQIKVDSAAPTNNWLPTVSSLFDVLPAVPASQASNIVFSNVGATSMTISWTNNSGDGRIVLVKPDTLLLPNELPLNGTTYFGNTIVGAGSNIGGAAVVYNGISTTVNITGLAPNTLYYVYVFNYNGTSQNENYRTTAASGNPRATTTTGSFDDDVTFGINNTRSLSKTIGTNSPIKGTIRSVSDEDWFNFTVTTVSPNVRSQIFGLAGNYTLEVYDMTGRRIRRSTLNGTSSEAAVINHLPAGTYTVRIFSQDGSYWTRAGEEYTLKVTTFGSEIYAVTP